MATVSLAERYTQRATELADAGLIATVQDNTIISLGCWDLQREEDEWVAWTNPGNGLTPTLVKEIDGFAYGQTEGLVDCLSLGSQEALAAFVKAVRQGRHVVTRPD